MFIIIQIFLATRAILKIEENINNRLYLARKYGRIFVLGLKVAEHSFRARFCCCNSARAQGFRKTNMP